MLRLKWSFLLFIDCFEWIVYFLGHLLFQD
jgi:hypothetical protein